MHHESIKLVTFTANVDSVKGDLDVGAEFYTTIVGTAQLQYQAWWHGSG